MSPGVRRALLSMLSNEPIIRVRDVCSRGACLICCCRQQREHTRFLVAVGTGPEHLTAICPTSTNKSYFPDFRENRFCVRRFHLWCMRWPAHDRARGPTVSGAIGAAYAR